MSNKQMNHVATIIFLLIDVTPFQAAILLERMVLTLIIRDIAARVDSDEKLGD
jgi:hypothetical protein